jgi:hypothetical protein
LGLAFLGVQNTQGHPDPIVVGFNDTPVENSDRCADLDAGVALDCWQQLSVKGRLAFFCENATKQARALLKEDCYRRFRFAGRSTRLHGSVARRHRYSVRHQRAVRLYGPFQIPKTRCPNMIRWTTAFKGATAGVFLLGIAALLTNGDSLRSQDAKKDDKIDVEAIKKATTKLLLSKNKDAKFDLSYITEDFVRKTMKEAKPLPKSNNGSMHGNHPFQDPQTNFLYWRYGNAGNVECGMENATYCPKNYGWNPEGSCNGGYQWVNVYWVGN